MRARILRTFGFVILGVVLVGFAYERVARAGDAGRYPAPGRAIDVGSHRLHLMCVGSGTPTIVLEAGLGETSVGWAAVQRELGRTSRVCAYDRAGLAWSDPGTTPRTARKATEELATLLRAAGEPSPYVLVAHSLGAFVAQLFVDLYPAEVAGLVLIDPTDEDAVIAAGQPSVAIIERWIYAALGEFGVLRLVGRALVNGSVGGHAPPEVLDAVPFLYRPSSQIATIGELDASVESARDVRATQPPTQMNLPVVVISAANATESDRERHQRLARTSHGRHVVATTGGHYVHYDDPRLVIDLIRSVVDRRASAGAAGGFFPSISTS